MSNQEHKAEHTQQQTSSFVAEDAMNSKGKSTPGPWKLGPVISKTLCRSVNSDRMRIADVGLEANARLIAAAPELLEACKAAFALIETLQAESPDDWFGCPLPVETQLQQAIAKAEGR